MILIQLFIALRRAQATTNRFVRQPFGHQGERMQVSFCLVGRHQQREQQVDRLIVDRVEGDGGFQLDKTPTARSAYPLPVFRRGMAIPLPIPVLPIFRG